MEMSSKRTPDSASVVLRVCEVIEDEEVEAVESGEGGLEGEFRPCAQKCCFWARSVVLAKWTRYPMLTRAKPMAAARCVLLVPGGTATDCPFSGI